MSKKLILILVIVVFLSKFDLARADLLINEFVSDPDTGSEWIELLNNSSSEINLNGWNWTELASPGTDTEHESSPKSLTGTVSAGGVFVFEMNSALNNGGDSIGLYSGTDIIDRVSFGKVNSYTKDLDVPTKGKSGALISGTWKTNQDPTKEEINPDSSDSSDAEGEEEDTGTASSSSSGGESATETKVKIPTQKTKVQITAKPLAYVGIPFILGGTGTDVFGEKLSHGKYYWNFGDGDFREVKVINTDKFTHTYFYPGDYTIIFEYYPDSFADTPDAAQKIIVKAVTPEITISSVGDEKDFFIELSNETSHDIDISNWILLSGQKSFRIPRNTILASKKKMIISARISNFSIQDKSSLLLTTGEGDLVFDYSKIQPPKSPRPNVVGGQALSRGLTNSSSPDKGRLGGVDVNAFDYVAENLPALANTNSNSNSSLIFPIISFMFIGASASAVYFIRRKKTIPSIADDFEILDE